MKSAVFFFTLTATLCSALSQVIVSTIFDAETTPLRKPSAIAVGLDGLIYIADTGNHRLVCVDSTGRIVAESSAGGSQGELRWPVDVAVGAAGKIFVADAGNRRIVEYTRLLELRSELEVTDADGNQLRPELIAATPTGELYVYETDNNELILYDSFNKVQARLGAKSGSEFTGMTDLAANKAGVIWIDRAEGTIYRSDVFLSMSFVQRAQKESTRVADISFADTTRFELLNSELRRYGSREYEAIPVESLPFDSTQMQFVEIAAASASDLYLLDARRGSLYKLFWP